MDLSFVVNGIEMQPGQPAVATHLRDAELGHLSPLSRLFRRLPGRYRYWEGRDPRVVCFNGEIEFYPCRHGYLNKDRRWGTHCLVLTRHRKIRGVEVRIVDGVYAAGNLYERFVDVGCECLGSPNHEGRDSAEWREGSALVTASYHRGDHHAVFRLMSDVG